MRHERFPKACGREITPKRLKAAERMLRRERDYAPLFADEIAEEQPTPEERLEQQEAAHIVYWQNIRNHVAQTWRKARRILASLPDDQRKELQEKWQLAPFPPRAEYFADFIYQHTGRTPSQE